MHHALAEVVFLPKVKSNEAAALAKELGLELQAQRYEKPLAEHALTPLTSDEVTVWSFHCPTRYVPGGGEKVKRLEQYGFDSVPVEVMRHWKQVKDNYAFDRFEVWTTERTIVQTDPLLIGVIGEKLYLLARWGMESPDNLSSKGIAQHVHDFILGQVPEWVRNKSCFWGDAEAKKRTSEQRVLDYACYHGSFTRDRAFQAARRLLGLNVPAKKHTYGWD